LKTEKQKIFNFCPCHTTGWYAISFLSPPEDRFEYRTMSHAAIPIKASAATQASNGTDWVWWPADCCCWDDDDDGDFVFSSGVFCGGGVVTSNQSPSMTGSELP
jgi:hypothetical protein